MPWNGQHGCNNRHCLERVSKTNTEKIHKGTVAITEIALEQSTRPVTEERTQNQLL